MKVKKADHLFANIIKSLHSAEEQLEKALPGLADKVQDKDLAKGMKAHTDVTKKQRERLEKIGDTLGFSPRGKKNKAMEGILEELKSDMQEIQEEELLDPEVIIAAQKVEHYEIAAYGSACALAKLMGKDQVLNLLLQTLDEEKEQDQLLTKVAEKSVNEKAMQVQ